MEKGITKTNNEKLKPCPFCQGVAKVYVGFMGLLYVRCDECGAIVSFDNSYCNKEPLKKEKIEVEKDE